jgi:hypothetical protein
MFMVTQHRQKYLGLAHMATVRLHLYPDKHVTHGTGTRAATAVGSPEETWIRLPLVTLIL